MPGRERVYCICFGMQKTLRLINGVAVINKRPFGHQYPIPAE